MKSTLRPTSHAFYKPTINLVHSQPQSTLNNLVDLLGGGIFRSVRSVHSTSSPINTIKLNNNARHFSHRASQSNRFITPTFKAASRNSASKTLFSGGLRAPSIPFPAHQAHKGLGSARQFSSGSGRSFYQNIIENVPLGLRALGDQTGLDDRKWKRDTRAISRSMRVKGGMRKIDEKERNLGMKKEFENYFGVVGGIFGLTLGEEGEVPVTDHKAVQEPISLILYLTPDFNILADYLVDEEEFGENLLLQSLNGLGSSQFRLLQPTPLDLIQSFRDLHAKKLSSIQANLLAAGVLEDEENLFEMNEKELKIIFGPNWERRDVEQVLGDYTSYNTNKNRGYKNGRGFYEIIGQDLPSSFSTCPSSPSLDSWTSAYQQELQHEQQHDLITSQFYLPSPHSTTSSSIESSNYYEDDLSTTWSLNGWESQGVEWDFGTQSQSQTQRFDSIHTSPSHSVGESSYHYQYQYQNQTTRPFSLEANQEEDEISSSGSEFDGLESSRSYERGVQNFLGDLEDAEREMEWRRAKRGN